MNTRGTGLAAGKVSGLSSAHLSTTGFALREVSAGAVTTFIVAAAFAILGFGSIVVSTLPVVAYTDCTNGTDTTNAIDATSEVFNGINLLAAVIYNSKIV